MALLSDGKLFSSFADDIYHLADILHARNFAHFESHAELVLDSAYEVDVLNAVPVLDIGRGSVFVYRDRIIAENVPENFVES